MAERKQHPQQGSGCATIILCCPSQAIQPLCRVQGDWVRVACWAPGLWTVGQHSGHLGLQEHLPGLVASALLLEDASLVSGATGT